MEYCYPLSSSVHDKFQLFGNIDLLVDRKLDLRPQTDSDGFVSRTLLTILADSR